MTPELLILLEKGGLLAGLVLAVHYLIRRLEQSQARIVGLAVDTIERNTEALIRLESILGRCPVNHERHPDPAKGDTRIFTRPKVLPKQTPAHAD